jgi:hypothetical protein
MLVAHKSEAVPGRDCEIFLKRFPVYLIYAGYLQAYVNRVKTRSLKDFGKCPDPISFGSNAYEGHGSYKYEALRSEVKIEFYCAYILA